MMIQLNLLPDVKLEYIRSRRSSRLVYTVAFIVALIAVIIASTLYINVKVIQTKHLHNLENQIQTATAHLQADTNFNKILTVQNQLATLPKLYSQRPIASLLLGFGSDDGYLDEITPSTVFINTISVDFVADSINIQGSANNIFSVNQYVDTLKFTNYYMNGNKKAELPAFNNVTLNNFSAASTGTVNYSVNLNFDPNLFNSALQPQLDVPTATTTRSQLETPSVLFNGKPTNITNQIPANSQSNTTP
jgi:hypothetical protein